MRKFIFLLFLITAFSCEKNDTEDLLPYVPVDVVINLGLPQYIDLNTPTGWAYTTGGNDGIQGIIVINTGATPRYKAFERACPNNDCTTPMTYDGALKLTCSCDKSEYSIIDGSPQTEGDLQFAREYRVLETDPSTLNITNY